MGAHPIIIHPPNPVVMHQAMQSTSHTSGSGGYGVILIVAVLIIVVGLILAVAFSRGRD